MRNLFELTNRLRLLAIVMVVAAGFIFHTKQAQIEAGRNEVATLSYEKSRLAELLQAWLGGDSSAAFFALHELVQLDSAYIGLDSGLNAHFEQLRGFAAERDSLSRISLQMSGASNRLASVISKMQGDLVGKTFFLDTLRNILAAQEQQNEELLEEIELLYLRIERLQQKHRFLQFTTQEGKAVRYYGAVENGKAQGLGMGSFEGGGVYEGEWNNGARHGQGTYRWANGDLYEGNFKNGKREGMGNYRFASGERYEGDWKNDLRHGNGRFFSAEGKLLLDGPWKDDKFVRR